MGPYSLLARIGEGGMGVVHLARGADGRRVALKVLRPHIVGDEEARARLAREVSSLGRVRSRWVAEIIDADPWAEVPYVATRYVPGLSLHDHTAEEGPITGGDLLWFAACLAEGVAAVHEVGVLHRDIKPSNVLMEGRTPILIDFGLARVADDPRLTHTGWLLGTPGYLAPEILYGDDATPASDVHSWAATVGYAALGRPPFGRGPSMAIMDRVRRGEHDLAGLTGPLHDVVVAALDPEPTRRPSLASILAWLRPQTTRPQPVLAPPPVGGAPDEEDPFTIPLAIAGPPADPVARETAPVNALPEDAPGPVDREDRLVTERWPDPDEGAGPRPTLVLPAERPDPPRAVAAPAPAVVPVPDQAWAQPGGWAQPAPGDQHWGEQPGAQPLEEWAPPRRSLAERARAATLVAASGAAVAAGFAAAPFVTAACVLLMVWLLRSGSLAASAAGDRRLRRGRRWYDGAQLVLHAPWHLVQSVPGTLLLVLWAAGLALAAALVCYAVAAGAATTLLVSGLVLAGSLWWGPGGSRVRSPVNRLLAPLASSPVTWLVALAVAVGVAAALGVVTLQQDVSWWPFEQRPLQDLSRP